MPHYTHINIRTVNAFLRKKGIDPTELVDTKKEAKLSRKDVAKIKMFLGEGLRALVYKKDGKIVVRDADHKLAFEKPEVREKALAVKNGEQLF